MEPDMGEAQHEVASEIRPEVSVFWKPGCSSCLKLKEFVEEQGIEFESVNLQEREDAMEEIVAAGLRGIPVLRKGRKYIYAQNLDEVANLLGVSRNHTKLSHAELVERWDEILHGARTVVSWFPEEQLSRRAILVRDRPIKDLCSHIFQIPETFLLMLEGSIQNERDHLTRKRDDIVTRADLLAYIERTISKFQDWRVRQGVSAIPANMMTYYGDQTSAQVLERGVWHSAQHARQLDTIAAGLGAEFQIPQELYIGLPMPQRLWA